MAYNFRVRYRTTIQHRDTIILDEFFSAKNDISALTRAEKMSAKVSVPPKKWGEWKHETSLTKVRISKVENYTQTLEKSSKAKLVEAL